MASLYPSKIIAAYRRLFNEDPQVLARAPGRINLMGGHVDYNGGLVLPMAIPYYVYTALGRGGTGEADFLAVDLEKRARFPLAALKAPPDRRGGWIDYIKGVMIHLLRRGAPVSGCRGVIGGDLIREAGLGSSAALGVSTALALRHLFGVEDGPENPADIAHLAESAYVGVRCGVMDPYASFYGLKDHLLLLDCRSRDKRQIPLRMPDHRLLICVTPAQRKLAASAYNERRGECERIVALLKKHDWEIGSLGDLAPESLEDASLIVPPALFPRCRHVVTEIERVRQTVRALASGEMSRIGALMNASFESLRDDYGVSLPELDRFFEMVRPLPGIGGVRLTGAGFGGCVIILAESARLEKIKKHIDDIGKRAFRQPIEILPASAVDGGTVCF